MKMRIALKIWSGLAVMLAILLSIAVSAQTDSADSDVQSGAVAGEALDTDIDGGTAEDLGLDEASQDIAQADADSTSPDRFIPTEELSQDLGASFPVDI
jgi:hypothetical protein